MPVTRDDDEDVLYSDFAQDILAEPPPADAHSPDGRRRRELVAEVIARYRRLSPSAIDSFAWPEQRRDHRAGDRNALMVAVYHIEFERQRHAPYAVELEEAHLTSAGGALSDAVHALLVADQVNREDFAFLTEPLSRLLGVDLAQRQHQLRPADATEPEPLVPYDAPPVDPLPGHALWAHTREQLERRLIEIHERDGTDVYVVDLHLDVDWFDFDVRAAGIEIRWNTRARLTSWRETWTPHPDLLAIDPDAGDDLPWNWPEFLGGEPAHTLWKRDTDPVGHELLTDYGQQLGLWYSDAELALDDGDLLMDRQLELTDSLAAGLPAAVGPLHGDGVIARIFGQAIPITFSAQDSHFAAWELGRTANPPELYALFGPIQERHWGPG